jgi:hypothetical protein
VSGYAAKILGAQNWHHNRYIVMIAMTAAHASVALVVGFMGVGMPDPHGGRRRQRPDGVTRDPCA